MAGKAGAIAIKVALFATLRKYTPLKDGGSVFWIDVPEGTTIDKLVAVLGIPATESKATFVNSLSQEGDYELQDKDKVAVFPPLAGG